MIILLSSEQNYPNEIALLEQMFEQGLTHFHLRKPDWTSKETSDFLRKLNSEYHSRIIIHDHYELLRFFKLKGIHYNKRNLKNWNTYLPMAQQLSVSTHSIEEVLYEGADVDYVFLSPIFDSISKQGYTSKFNDDELIDFLKKELPTKVIALGGIEKSNVDHYLKLGFDGVALLGGIWNNDDPVGQFKEILNDVKETS